MTFSQEQQQHVRKLFIEDLGHCTLNLLNFLRCCYHLLCGTTGTANAARPQNAFFPIFAMASKHKALSGMAAAAMIPKFRATAAEIIDTMAV
jgi:hypothetical protein